MTKTTMTVKTFGATLGDRLRQRTTLQLHVVPTTYGAVVTDATHLKYNATFKDVRTAQAAAYVAMARRTR